MSMKTVVIAGGGTGGHIYPAIAVAQALTKKMPGTQIHFVGTKKGLEKKIVPREGFPLHFVTVGALNQVTKMQKVISLILIPLAILQSFILIFKLRPQAVLGVGGYASGPFMLAARLAGTPTFLFEPNAHPGLTNRWLAPFVRKAFLNFEIAKKFFNESEVVGIPVRDGLNPAKRESSSKLRVLIFGGSQGARGINNTVLEAVKRGGGWLDQVEVVHQIGSTDFAKIDAAYKNLNPKNIKWFEFLYDMPERYKWADLVICRAGASTLAELAACSKAAVLIPFPAAADNHQQKNAEALASENAAIMVVQKDFTADKFTELVDRFLRNRENLVTYEERVPKFFRPKSAEKIAEALLK